MRKKNIDLWEARELSEKFCDDFKVPYCEIYYVDRLIDCIGVYIWLDPPHILMDERVTDKLPLLMHELIHHLDSALYENIILNHSSPNYILAKKRVITWCKKNISTKPDWFKALKACNNREEMKKFQL